MKSLKLFNAIVSLASGSYCKATVIDSVIMAPAASSPIKCGACLNEFSNSDQKVNCGGWCNGFFHKQCINLSRDKVKILLETPSFKWFCQSCDEGSSTLTTLLVKIQTAVERLEQTVSRREEVINTQNFKIMKLNESLQQLTLKLNSSHVSQMENSAPTATSPVTRGNEIPQDKRNLPISGVPKQTTCRTGDGARTATQRSAPSGRQQRQRQQSQKSGQNADLESATVNDEGFQLVRPKRQQRARRAIVNGTNKTCDIKAIGKNAWIYVTRLDKETSERDVQQLLEGTCKVACEKLNLKHSDRWSSFRICAPFQYKDIILDGQLWPEGAQIGRYFFPRKQESGENAENSEMDGDDNFLNRTTSNPVKS